jgi:hypothetical protein
MSRSLLNKWLSKKFIAKGFNNKQHNKFETFSEGGFRSSDERKRAEKM